MRSRIALFIVVVLLAVAVIDLALIFPGSGGRGHEMGSTFPQSLRIGLVVVPLVLAIAVFAYATLFPELSEKKPTQKISMREKGYDSALDGILRVLKEDERRVVEALIEEGGTMLQKDIRWKLGLSRVKIHRILARLAERGIVTAEKHYNTNKITLADWLLKKED